jgi:hypothetical protein
VDAWTTLGENTSILQGCWNVENSNISKGNPFSHKVNIILNMLGAIMLNQVGGEVDNAGVAGPVKGSM